MRLTILFTIILLVTSCGTKKKNEFKPNDRLISFSDKLLMEMDSLLKLDSSFRQSIYSDKFNEKTDTIRYDGNQIYISYLSIVTGCADYAGDIQFKGDSIILDLINKVQNKETVIGLRTTLCLCNAGVRCKS
jgi:RNA processing factor Prp31